PDPSPSTRPAVSTPRSNPGSHSRSPFPTRTCIRRVAALLIASLAGAALSAQAVTPTKAALAAHYQRVLVELRAADTSHLSSAQQAERRRLIAALADYERAADFGINRRFPGERMPHL